MRFNYLMVMRLGLFLILLMIPVCPVCAGIRPSFSVEYSTWHASDIVLVEITSEDGVFSVVEAWKGELQAGERINVPELKPGRGAMPILLYPRTTDNYAVDNLGISERIPRQQVGSQMVLFLKKAESSSGPDGGKSDKSQAKWLPASLLDEMKASAVWINGIHLYCFRQVVNPGASILVSYDLSLAELNKRVHEVAGLQRGLEDVVRIENAGERAEKLKPYARSEIVDARMMAVRELGKCGPSGSVTIRGMLEDPAFGEEARGLVNAYVGAGGESVGEDLNRLLQERAAFWQATAPSLSPG